MRGNQRKTHHEDEEESVFVSMTDMTVSFLFIVMILLAFFASQFENSDTVARVVYNDVVKQKNDLDTENQKLVKKVSDQYQEIEQLKTLISTLTVERDQARTGLTQAELKIAELQNNINSLSALILKLQSEVTEKDKKISDLKENLAKLDAENKYLKELLAKSETKDPLEKYMAEIAKSREKLLRDLQNSLKIEFPDLQVELSEQNDALRFKGDGLFAPSSFALRPEKQKIVEKIASSLNAILPCYTFGEHSNWNPECNSGGAVIEAVQIEGHTDSDGSDDANMTLSTNRANQTFFAMKAKEPLLVEHRNYHGEPVLSVAGYGKMRPVVDNSTKENKSTNRRIDLRIIMYAPKASTEIGDIRRALSQTTNGLLKQ